MFTCDCTGTVLIGVANCKVTVLCVLCPPCTVLCHRSFSVVDVLCNVLHVISRMLLHCAASSVLLLYYLTVLCLQCCYCTVLCLQCCYCTMLCLQCCYCTALCLQCCYCTVLCLQCCYCTVLCLQCCYCTRLYLQCCYCTVLCLQCFYCTMLCLQCCYCVCRGGKICLTDHFKPLWARNVPKFGIAHAMALGVRSSCAPSFLLSSALLRKTRWISDRHCGGMCAVAMLSFHVLCYLKTKQK